MKRCIGASRHLLRLASLPPLLWRTSQGDLCQLRIAKGGVHARGVEQQQLPLPDARVLRLQTDGQGCNTLGPRVENSAAQNVSLVSVGQRRAEPSTEPLRGHELKAMDTVPS